MRSNAPPETNASRDIPPRAPRLCVHQTGSRGGAEIGSAAATSGRGMPRHSSDVGARHAASRQRRWGAACRVAAATSGHGMPRRGRVVGARHAVPRPRHLTLSRVEFLGEMCGLLHSHAFCPSSPQPPSPTRGEGGVWASGQPKREKERRVFLKTYPCKHPPCPLLPQGEKGEFGRPDA
jgi:hypothetical protein